MVENCVLEYMYFPPLVNTNVFSMCELTCAGADGGHIRVDLHTAPLALGYISRSLHLGHV